MNEHVLIRRRGFVLEHEHKRLYLARRKSRAHGTADTLTAQEWYSAILMYQCRCAYCGVKLSRTPGKPHSLSLDHFVPVACGGDTSAANVLPVCVECNNQKHETPPELWLRQRFPMNWTVIYQRSVEYLRRFE